MTCVELRRGDGDGETLFVFTGAGGEPDELVPLVAAMRERRVVAVLPFATRDNGDAPESTIGEMAVRATALVREYQTRGPYRLLGYSFGGLIALEAAELLVAAGEEVSFVGLVDPIYDRRYWTFDLFARSTLRRTGRHLRRLTGQPPGAAWSELRQRSKRLAAQIANRAVKGATVTSTDHVDDFERANVAALSAWQPRRFELPVVLFAAANDSDWGCDSAPLWARYLSDLRVCRVEGTHADLVRVPAVTAALARAVDDALDAVDTPLLRVLLAATFGWEASGRLAVELAAAGCAVFAVAPRASALHGLSTVTASFRLDLVRPLASLRRAIVEAKPDLVIPFDDRTRQALHQVYDRADPATADGALLREVMRRSLGPAEIYPHIYSRAAIMALASASGVRVPPTAPAPTLDDVLEWMRASGGAAVLKTDGSWGGREVAVAHDPTEAARAWRRLSRPPGWARILKRLVVDRDPWPLRARVGRRPPTISVQAFVPGRPGNVAAACVDGELLGAVQAEVVRSDGDLGPSTVLRVIEHPEMRATATAMVRELGLTGLCGFDFVLEHGSDRAHLLEVNPRATPTSHLVAADGVDLLTSLRAALGHAGPPARTRSYPDGLVALFPQEMRRDPDSPYLTTAYHDVPESSELVEHALRHRRG